VGLRFKFTDLTSLQTRIYFNTLSIEMRLPRVIRVYSCLVFDVHLNFLLKADLVSKLDTVELFIRSRSGDNRDWHRRDNKILNKYIAQLSCLTSFISLDVEIYRCRPI
jgi:hypothetical protein